MTSNAMKQLLSYEPLKSILANMSLESREKIVTRFPSLRKTNKVVPYTFDSATISNCDIFRVDGHYTQFPRKDHSVNHQYYICSYDGISTVYGYEAVEKEFLKLVLHYIQDGTRIRKLVYDDLPKGMKEMNFKIHISELSLVTDRFRQWRMNVEKFQKLLPMIKDSIPLKKVEIEFNMETRPLFEEPLVKTCSELSIYIKNFIIGDLLHHLNNKHIHLQVAPQDNWADSFVVVRNLARHWLNTEKSVGRTFTLPYYHFAVIGAVINHMKVYLGARITKILELGDNYLALCAVIPINDTLEIVVFGTKYEQSGVEIFALRMAVKPRGSTNALGFFE